MKRVLAFCLMVLAASSLFGRGAGEAPDQYRTTYATEVKTLNYFLLLDTTALRVAANTMDGLVENDRYGKFVPSLAERWDHNEDYTEWTFYLRPGVKWVDSMGQETAWEVTADDFVEGMRFIAEPKNGIKNVGIIRKVISGLNGYYWDLVDIDDGVDIGKTREEALASFDSSVGVSAPDKYTVKYTLDNPTPYFLSYLVTELFFPLEKEFLDSVGAEDFGTTKEKLIFTGAYYLAEWQRDKEIRLAKNEHYWDADSVNVGQVSLQKVADDSIRVQMFQRGEVSATTLQGDQVKALEGTKWADNVFLDEKSSVTYWFAMNYTSDNPEARAFINNVNFRKALYHGIDRAKLLELVNPYEPEALLRNTIIPEDVIFDENGQDYTDYPLLKEVKERRTYDRELAQEYFQKAVDELTDGKGNIKGISPATVDMLPIAEIKADGKLPVQILFVHPTDPTKTREALLLQEMLRDTFDGQVELVLGQYVDDKYNDTIKPRRFDLLYDSFSFKYADPMAQLGRLVTDGSVNDGQYSFPEFDRLVEEADGKTSLTDRYEIFSRAERFLIDNAVIIPWQAGGGAYSMDTVVPFSTPRGGFGVTRFKYKGMILQQNPITADQYKMLEKAFRAELAPN
ncbi:peptide ABC transporter substrate-binding protein [Spirochaeta isovalerica]|uniref:Oligopeptide transport system substrate-binding protein n=1 Tax=Spirochaeta isovalerica TaxID=150 RepID=A0A841R7W3_9SPIO|nr:peptide ABC transporter substrate-binding protein [Spirochaeta isovalerica]MBB6479955.1 oligopeptide transport system substrate-binding protein [Spirochaeta isovalerica]